MSDAPEKPMSADDALALALDDKAATERELKKQLSLRRGQHRRVRRRLAGKVLGIRARLERDLPAEQGAGAIKACEAIVKMIEEDAFSDEE